MRKILMILIVLSFLSQTFITGFAENSTNTDAETTAVANDTVVTDQDNIAEENIDEISTEDIKQQDDEAEKAALFAEQFDKKVEMLKAVGLFPSEFVVKPEEEVKRFPFAKVLNYLLNLQDQAGAYRAETVYDDVLKSNKEAGYINILAQRDIFSQIAEEKFLPEQAITLGEAVCCLLKTMSYDTFINSKYGEINDKTYFSAAGEIKLLKNVTAKKDSPLTYRDLANLIYNALDVSLLVIKDASQSGVSYELSEDNNILSVYHGIYKKTGIITSDGYGSINDKKSAKGTIFVDDEEFISEINTFGYVGKKTDCYYNDEDEVVYLELLNTKNIIIQAPDIDQYNSFTYTYFPENSSNIKEASILKSADIVYNGSTVSEQELSSINFTPKCGYVELVDCDNNGQYELLKIWDYKYYVFDRVNKNSEEIIFKNDGYKLDISSGSNAEFYDIYGKPVSNVDTVAGGAIMGVLENIEKSYVFGYFSQNTVAGKISSIDSSDPEKLSYTIQNKKYYVGQLPAEQQLINVGTTCVAFLDINNRIFYFERKGDSDYMLAYIMKARKAEDEIGETVFIMNLFDVTTAKEVMLNVRDKVNIDGVAYKTIDAYMDMFYDSVKERARYQLIQYKTNSENKIVNIDTVDKTKGIFSNPSDGIQTFYESPIKNQETGAKEPLWRARYNYLLIADDYNPTTGAKGGGYKEVFPATPDIPVLFVPQDRENAELYASKINAEYNGAYPIDAFKIAGEKALPDFIVVYAGDASPVLGSNGGINHSEGILDEDPCVIVKKVGNAYNADTEEVVHELEIFEGGKTKTLKTYDNYLAQNTKAGDIIKYCVNEAGDIWGMQYVVSNADLSLKTGKWAEKTGNHALNTYRATLFNAYIRKGEIVGLTTKDPSLLVPQTNYPAEDMLVFNVSGFESVYIIDTQKGTVEVGCADDIITYTESVNDFSKVFVYTKSGLDKMMVIYK